jgi:peptide/nickel transport system permease protein
MAEISLEAAPSRTPRHRGLPLNLVIGSVLVAFFCLVALVSFFWTPYPSEAIKIADRLRPPGEGGFVFGTDRMGRDVLSQVMVGARNSLLVAVFSTIAATIPGLAIGLAIAAMGEPWRGLFAKVVDVGIALPSILIALVVATAIGPGNAASMIAISLGFVPHLARVVIGPARQVLAREFIEAAYAYGRKKPFIMIVHVLPNIGPLVIVQVSIMLAAAILIEASLSFLGIGAQRPAPSWGRLLNEALPLLDKGPWLPLLPGIAIVLTVLGFNLLGDGLRVLLDPQQKSGGDSAP